MRGEFESHVERHGDAVVVYVAGELDLAAAERFRELLDGPQAQAQRVVLDLSGVQFIDSSGLSVIVATHRRAAADGFSFAVATGGVPAVVRVLSLTGLDGTIKTAHDPATLLGG